MLNVTKVLQRDAYYHLEMAGAQPKRILDSTSFASPKDPQTGAPYNESPLQARQIAADAAGWS